MKVTSKKALQRRYHISLLVFLFALGLLPASLMTSGVFAETEREVTERVAEPDETPEGETIEAISKVEIKEVAEEYAVYEEPVVTEVVQTTYALPAVQVADQISIAGNTIPIFYSSNTLIDAGDQVGLYGTHFLYGHNTANVFGGLAHLGEGARFTVTLGGETKTYQVVRRVLQLKSHFEGTTTVSGRTMKVMKAFTAYGGYEDNYYDYILMTCAGTSYGNGDASHRLVLFANEI